SILDCVRALVSYPELCWGHSRVTMRVGADGIHHACTVDSEMPPGVENPEAVRRYLVTVDLIAGMRVYGDIFGPGYQPLAVHLPYPAPADGRQMARALGCPLEFDAPEARIYLPERILQARPVLANPVAFRAYERLTAQLAKMLRADVSLATRVKRQLWTGAPPPDREQIASLLGMSSRSLARKLAREGTSYGELQREVRLARAKEYLKSRDLRVSQIGALLGFSDATAFSRAFRSWVGATPSAWRDSQRRDRRSS
ncbi:MAG: AraC family transcriptional regulator, partial [Deltaproteobacteria bacterium]|nr:AraC family transcriptional regulator [Deltaproteobacteria bacterium]